MQLRSTSWAPSAVHNLSVMRAFYAYPSVCIRLNFPVRLTDDCATINMTAPCLQCRHEAGSLRPCLSLAQAPAFNFPNESRRRFCADHKVEGMVNLRKKRPRSDAIIGQAQNHVDEYIAEPPPQQYSQYPEEAAAAFAQAQAQHLAVQQAATATQMESQVCPAAQL